MNKQLTVKDLKKYLKNLPDNIQLFVDSKPLYYLKEYKQGLSFSHSEINKEIASYYNVSTILTILVNYESNH